MVVASARVLLTLAVLFAIRSNQARRQISSPPSQLARSLGDSDVTMYGVLEVRRPLLNTPHVVKCLDLKRGVQLFSEMVRGRQKPHVAVARTVALSASP